MFIATLLALGAAVLHAGWNLAVKQATGDRFIALWGQFFMAAAIAIVVLTAAAAAGSTVPASGWGWAAVSGAVHLPYCILLARAYDTGEFSQVYPIARGGGALLAGLGGLWLLDDAIAVGGLIGLAVVAVGLALLAGRAPGRGAWIAAAVACTIGAYSVVDAQGIRSSGTSLYAAATFVGVSASTTIWGLARGRRQEMRRALATNWRRFALVGLAAATTYTMVQFAFRRAPVGYVTGLRESSVLIAALVGVRLGEGQRVRRTVASVVVFTGLILLIAFR